jgi:prolyl oligopeptidase
MAYSIKQAGSDWETIHLKDVSAKKDMPDDKLEWVKFSKPSWTIDHKGFFYSRF